MTSPGSLTCELPWGQWHNWSRSCLHLAISIFHSFRSSIHFVQLVPVRQQRTGTTGSEVETRGWQTGDTRCGVLDKREWGYQMWPYQALVSGFFTTWEICQEVQGTPPKNQKLLGFGLAIFGCCHLFYLFFIQFCFIFLRPRGGGDVAVAPMLPRWPPGCVHWTTKNDVYELLNDRGHVLDWNALSGAVLAQSM